MTGSSRLPWIDENEIARIHPLIFHYTQARSLDAILRSSGLYATDYRYTNDGGELKGTRDIMVKHMAQAAIPLIQHARNTGLTHDLDSDDDVEALAFHDAAKFFDVMIRAIPTPPYLTCFSAHTKEHHAKNGVLTLWRTYGAENGIALGFNTKGLVAKTYEIQKSKAVDLIYIDRVSYGSDDPLFHRRFTEAPDVMGMYAEWFGALLKNGGSDFKAAAEALTKFLVLVCSSKHPDFADEREIRLVVSESIVGGEQGRASVSMRGRHQLLLQYLDVLDTVMIGPSKEQDRIAADVRVALENAGLSNVAVTKSDTLFRAL